MILGLIQVKKSWINDWGKARLIPEKLKDRNGKSSADPEALGPSAQLLLLVSRNNQASRIETPRMTDHKRGQTITFHGWDLCKCEKLILLKNPS